MIDRTHELCHWRSNARYYKWRNSTAYYQPTLLSCAELATMRRIDELHLNHPFAGSRMLSRMLKCEGNSVGHRHVSTVMKRMGNHALYRKPNTSRSHSAHPIYPFLFRNLSIAGTNHVWAADITSIPMKRGFIYLFAVIDWGRRRVLS